MPLIDVGTQRLPSIIGHGNAVWMILGGRRVDAARTLQLGLVHEVVSRGDALARASEFAASVVAYPHAALVADRASVPDAREHNLVEGLRREFNRGKPLLKDPVVIDRIHRHVDPS